VFLGPEEIAQMATISFRQFASGHQLLDQLRDKDFSRSVYVFTKACAVRLVIEEISELPPSRANITSMKVIYEEVAHFIDVFVNIPFASFSEMGKMMPVGARSKRGSTSSSLLTSASQTTVVAVR
jgi:hypothetical protein